MIKSLILKFEKLISSYKNEPEYKRDIYVDRDKAVEDNIVQIRRMIRPNNIEGYPAAYCEKCNMFVFYGFFCPTCKTPKEELSK